MYCGENAITVRALTATTAFDLEDAQTGTDVVIDVSLGPSLPRRHRSFCCYCLTRRPVRRAPLFPPSIFFDRFVCELSF